ncbi:glycoside hydrolase family 68 protein [Candidatus Kaiserbacteria bacterium]|nr:glycoside hydrolase family 68 protein [Candidatus Kaiserbacteria bacterium]
MDKYADNYSPTGRLLWDSWFINRKDECHVFHLQSRSKINPIERHTRGASIGHAISKDYMNWQEQPTALIRGERGEWDDKDLWSGSVAEKDGVYYLYYGGTNSAPKMENIQKIGLATSKDLHTWVKHPQNPILEVDSRYYQLDNERNAIGKIGAWRDPFVFKDPNSEKRYMTISARVKGESREYNACVALAESDNMTNWKVLPPIFSPGVYDEIEVSRVIFHSGLYYLFFTTHAGNYKPDFAQKHGAHEGLHCYYSENLFGGYKPVNGNGVVSSNGDEIYDIRVLHIVDNDFIGIGWLNHDEEGKFIGKLSHPMKIRIEGDRVYEI